MDNNTVKLSKEAYAAVIDIFRRALIELADASEELKDLRFTIEGDELIPIKKI